MSQLLQDVPAWLQGAVLVLGAFAGLLVSLQVFLHTLSVFAAGLSRFWPPLAGFSAWLQTASSSVAELASIVHDVVNKIGGLIAQFAGGSSSGGSASGGGAVPGSGIAKAAGAAALVLCCGVLGAGSTGCKPGQTPASVIQQGLSDANEACVYLQLASALLSQVSQPAATDVAEACQIESTAANSIQQLINAFNALPAAQKDAAVKRLAAARLHSENVRAGRVWGEVAIGDVYVGLPAVSSVPVLVQ